MTGAGGLRTACGEGTRRPRCPQHPLGGIPSTEEQQLPQGGSAAGTGREQPGCEKGRDKVWDEV